jgi:hypothetical protein
MPMPAALLFRHASAKAFGIAVPLALSGRADQLIV